MISEKEHADEYINFLEFSASNVISKRAEKMESNLWNCEQFNFQKEMTNMRSIFWNLAHLVKLR